ncbi:hypothetical protein Tco_0227656, partial [Tanacetum coccineum]
KFFGKFNPPSRTGGKIEAYGDNIQVKWDPNNIELKDWLASKFKNHETMDGHTSNALWDYWIRGDDEEIVQIFRIDIDIFHYETPLCEAFKEFNYLLKIDVDVLTNDIPGFKTHDEYKDTWIYESNKDVPWVANRLWVDYGPWMEPSDDVEHFLQAVSLQE